MSGKESSSIRLWGKELQKYVDAVCTNYSLNDALIQSQKGGAFSALTIVQLFARLYNQAGITGASSHSGRRQFITTLAEKQVNVRVIQALARHRPALASAQRQSRTISSISSGGVLPVTEVQK